MKMKKRIFAKAVFIPVVFGAALLIYSAVFGASGRNGLYFLTTPEEAVGGDCLVVVTHGWIEKGSDWPKDMAEAISERVDSNDWRCAYFNWSEGAMTINPTDAAEYARDFAGDALAEQVLKLNSNFKHIHLIGHSSGCWAVSEAAKIIAAKSKADIHLTFFDAYLPKSFDVDSLGDINMPADVNLWIDHYYTRDYTADLTARDLANAHNVDLTEIDQFIKDHNFPWKWYYSTIAGKFPKYSFMDDEKTAADVNGIEYGFSRSREAGPNAWGETLKLEAGNKAIKLNFKETD